MFSKTILITLVAVSSVFAAPLESRQINPSVTLCSNKDYNDCDTVHFHFGICEPAGRLNDKVSSLNANGHKCVFYNDTGCRNGGGQIDTSGAVSNIRTHPNFSTMNDDVSSFLCTL
ncbi:hypothetical protein CDEST_10973 [Colletotrichum destructivum]|uniref:Uncharacterized protein n=1 Tax=Colletotrichum destructivum TaxID=34406 RepID=A0AAX4IRU4_9PEZI|nr:hypothetical protein CDEST_10973 [Colletotrichum destructivum]